MVARSVVTEGLAGLDERLRALQVSISREAASAQERQAEMARAVAVQATDHAVLAQWMKDWTAEVTAWRKCIEERMSAVDARVEDTGRDLDQARGAMRVALWVFGTALTLITGIFSGVMVRIISEVMPQTAR